MPFGVDDAILGASALQAGASLFGANQQSRAANAANARLDSQYYATREALAPWTQAGTTALSDLQSRLPGLTTPFGMQQFQESPAYQFNLQQGKQAIDKAAAARSGYYQPATLQDISRFSQGLASNEFQNAFNNYWTNQGNQFNMLNTLSGQGQNAAAQTGAFGANAAGQIGQNMMGGANAQAAGLVGGANAITGGLSSVYNNYLMNQILSRNQGSMFGGGGGPDLTGMGMG